ncbi:MAG: hypothetical protein GY754_15820 [bacterium]|nr:hypothetical protein [bacterium]
MRLKKQLLKRLTGVILTLAAIYGFSAGPLIAGKCDFSSKKLEPGCDHEITDGKIDGITQKITSIKFNRDISNQVKFGTNMYKYKVSIDTDVTYKSNANNDKNRYNAALFWVKAENKEQNEQIETLGKVYNELGYVHGSKEDNKIPILSHITLPCLGNKNKQCLAYYLMDAGFDIEEQTPIDFYAPPEIITKKLIDAVKEWGKEAKIQLLAELVHFARVTLTNMKVEPGSIVQVSTLLFNVPNAKTKFKFDEAMALSRNPRGLFTIPWLTMKDADKKDGLGIKELEKDFRYKLLKVIQALHNDIMKEDPIDKYLPGKLPLLLEATDGHLSAEGHGSEFAFNVPMMLIQYNLKQNHNIVYAYEARPSEKENTSTELNTVMMNFHKQRTKEGIKTSEAIHSLARLWSQHFRERWAAMAASRKERGELLYSQQSYIYVMNINAFEMIQKKFYAHAGGLLAKLLLDSGVILRLGDIESKYSRPKSTGKLPQIPLYKNWEKHLAEAIAIANETKSKLVLRMGVAHALSSQNDILAGNDPISKVVKKMAQGSHENAFNNLSLLNKNGIKTVALCAMEPKYYLFLSKTLLSVKFLINEESGLIMSEQFSPYAVFEKKMQFYGFSKSIQALIPQKHSSIFKQVKLEKEARKWVPGMWDK